MTSGIAFARMQPFKKFATGCMGDKLDYIGRRGRYAARRDLLAGPCTILPVGAPSRFRDERRLWAEAEDKERAGGIVAVEILVALPPEGIMTTAEATAFCRKLAADISLEHSLAVTFAIHADSDGKANTEQAGSEAAQILLAKEETANRHVHMLVTSRQVSAVGFSKRRYNALLPSIGGRSLSPSTVRGSVHVVDATNFQSMVKQALERALARAGKPVSLRINAVHPAYHVGPVAAAKVLLNDIEAIARRPDGEAILRKIERMRVNSEIEIRNRQAVSAVAPLLEHLSDQIFTLTDIENLVSRYCSSLVEQARIVQEVMRQALYFTGSDRAGTEKFYILPRYRDREAHISELFSKLAARSALNADGVEGLAEQVQAGRTLSLLEIKTPGQADALDRFAEELQQRGETIVMACHLNKRRSAPTKIRLLPLHWQEPPMVPSGAIVLVDDFDDLLLPQLERLLEATLLANARLVLCRRSYRSDFVPHPLLSALLDNARSAPGSAQSSGLPFELVQDRTVEFHSDITSLVRRAALYNAEAIKRGRTIFFLNADPLVTKLLSQQAHQGHTSLNVGPFVPAEWNGPVIVLHAGIACNGAHLLSVSALKPQFLVAANIASDIPALAAQLRCASGRLTTITNAVAPCLTARPYLIDGAPVAVVEGPAAANARQRLRRSGLRSSMEVLALMAEDDIRPDDFDAADLPRADDDPYSSLAGDSSDDPDLCGQDDPDPDEDDARLEHIIKGEDEDETPP